MGERGGAGEGVRTVAEKREESGTFCSAFGVELACCGAVDLNPKSARKANCDLEVLCIIVLWSLYPFFSPSQLLALYRGLIRPCMEFGSHVWGGQLTQLY